MKWEIKRMSNETIYIQLLEEGTQVWKPTKAEPVSENVYKVLKPYDYDPDDEKWEFVPGTIVRCEKQLREGKQIWVAVSTE